LTFSACNYLESSSIEILKLCLRTNIWWTGLTPAVAWFEWPVWMEYVFYFIFFLLFIFFLKGEWRKWTKAMAVNNVLFCAWSLPVFGARGNQWKAINNVGVVYQSISRILIKSFFFSQMTRPNHTLYLILKS